MAGTTTDFLNRLGKFPLLTAEQEITLGHQVQAWLPLKGKPDPTTAERATIRMGERAYRKLYQSNLRLAVHVSRKFFRLVESGPGGIDHDDLLQEACLGLARAIEKFDPTRGYKFSTYSYWWIRQGITRALDNQGSTIRLPSGWRADLGKLLRLIEAIRLRTGKNPTTAELTDITGLMPEKIEALLANSRQISLDAKARGGKDDNETNDIIDCIAAPTPDEDPLEKSDELNRLKDAIKLLDETDQRLLEQHYGVNGSAELTLTEMGEERGKSREAVRHNIRRAVNRLKFQMGELNSLQEDFSHGWVTGRRQPKTYFATHNPYIAA